MFALGRTLFAGPLLGVLVTASGAITCAASPSADLHRTAYVPSAPAAQAVCTGAAQVEKIVTASAPLVVGTAAVGGGAKVEFVLGADGAAQAAVTGRALAEFFLAGAQQAVAQATARGYRAVKFRGLTQASATLDADPQLWAVAAGRTLAVANPFGTTNYVGTGVADAAALATTGVVQRLMPGSGQVVALVELTAAARAEFFAGGTGAGYAALHAEPAWLHSGVLTYEASGASDAAAAASNAEPLRYSVALAVGTAALDAAPSRNRAGQGEAVGAAATAGWAELVLPTLAAAVLTSEAYGTALAHRVAGAEAHVLSAAVGTASSCANFSGRGASGAVAALANIGLELRPKAQGCAAKADVHGAVHLEVVEVAEAVAQAAGVAQAAAQRLARGTAPGAALPVAQAELVVKILLSGAAVGEAQLSGANRVNDYAFAPAARTLTVPRFARLVVVTGAPRVIATAGSNRRAAA